MTTADLMMKIRPLWLERVSRRLARGEGVRESFADQLNQFFDLLLQAIATGDPAWLNPILDSWASSRTQSELEKQEASLGPMLNEILLVTHEVVHEMLASEQALEIIGSILPVYGYAFQYTSVLEAKLHINHISSELDRAHESLERLDKTKSDFIAVAAHELKTPLTLIEGYAAMLRDNFPDAKDESMAAILMQGVDNGARRLREIVDDMIDVSLLDNNMLQMNFQPVWINQLLQIARRELSQIIVERNQKLIMHSFPGIDEMTFGDSERLYQALRNILTNAIKYTPDGGTITVNGRLLPGFVEITVADTGIGIDEDDLERIFEKFGRIGNVALHSSGKTKFKGGGPGLGLPITKGIIEAHGGAIWVESEGYDEILCPGATFHILLPIVKEAPDKKVSSLFKPLMAESQTTDSPASETVDSSVLTTE